ncbi:homocysteine biosynthesis protein [Desulfomonile tiedjei]|nr:homocysteine biosynthesis protein [Desulfomonile tiedjei]
MINSKIMAGEAKVYTEMELLNRMKSGEDLTSLDVDLITMAFHSSISGSAAMLLVPVAGRGTFTRAKKIWLNGVPGHPGPAPNERLGVVDTLIFADEVCDDTSEIPCGARLLVDILNNREIRVKCLSAEGDMYHNSFASETLQFARMFTYNTFIPTSRVNAGDDGPSMNAHLRTIRRGNKVLLNKVPGIVIGRGSYGSSAREALSLSAEMFGMTPLLIHDQSMSNSSPIAYSVALAIPVLDDSVLASVSTYLSKMKPEKDTRYFTESDEKLAEYLKELILKKEFHVTDSDVEVLYDSSEATMVRTP